MQCATSPSGREGRPGPVAQQKWEADLCDRPLRAVESKWANVARARKWWEAERKLTTRQSQIPSGPRSATTSSVCSCCRYNPKGQGYHTSMTLSMHRKSGDHLKVTWYIVRFQKNMVYKNTRGGGGGFDFQTMVYIQVHTLAKLHRPIIKKLINVLKAGDIQFMRVSVWPVLAQ